MDLKRLLKASIMVLLVGSSFLFASPLVQKAATTVEANPNKELGISSKVDKQEILFWTSILAALGAAVYLLTRILAAMSELQWKDFEDILLTKQSALYPSNDSPYYLG